MVFFIYIGALCGLDSYLFKIGVWGALVRKNRGEVRVLVNVVDLHLLDLFLQRFQSLLCRDLHCPARAPLVFRIR